MAKGKYIKAAERACAGKARYDSALLAEKSCEWRLRAYQCPVCHAFHLTSRDGAARTEPERPIVAKAEPGPKLGDLNWSAALNPQPKPPRPPKRVKPRLPEPPPFQLARCASLVGKDGRVRLVIDGRLVKSAPVKDKALRALIVVDAVIKVTLEDPPKVMAQEK